MHWMIMKRTELKTVAAPTARCLEPVVEEHTITVGEVASRSGVAVSAIRFYEVRGLIRSTRTSGNQRRYARNVLRRIAVIRIAQRAGLSLAEIKSHMDTLPEGRITVEEWERLSSGWRELIDKRITGLTQLRDRLGGCIGCGCLSLRKCPLRNAGDVLGKQGPGPRLLLLDE